jgi:hypothetical protein
LASCVVRAASSPVACSLPSFALEPILTYELDELRTDETPAKLPSQELLAAAGVSRGFDVMLSRNKLPGSIHGRMEVHVDSLVRPITANTSWL